MAKVGYTLMTEQAGPKDLVRWAARAEEAGFDLLVSSDHYFPWLDGQGHAPNVWVTLGAVAQVTGRAELMTYVTCPTMRYHPAVVAQPAGVFPRADSGLDAGGGGVAAPQLALRGDLHAAGSALGRVLRDERGEPAVYAAGHHGFRLPADARTGSSSPVLGSYPHADLMWWADRIREWDLAGLDVFVYFNNDGNANEVRNARTLATLPVSALPHGLQHLASRKGPPIRDPGPLYAQVGAYNSRCRPEFVSVYVWSAAAHAQLRSYFRARLLYASGACRANIRFCMICR